MTGAVLDVGDFVVNHGEVVALLGANGAGKTELLETILGFRPGNVRFLDEEVGTLPVEERVRRGMGYVPAGRRVFAGLTVRENLEASCVLPATQRRRQVDEILSLFPMLDERPAARAWLLSGGQQQMLALARALVNRPKLLLLDEPTLGLAPRAVGELWGHLQGLAGGGTAILLAEQRAALALRVASRAVVLQRGRIVRMAPAPELLADPALASLMGG
jgi:branched-chain amino acid transport system ATP-binding protein